MAQHNEQITCLTTQLGAIEIPPGFIKSDGRVTCPIPISTGELVIPCFIQRLGTGEVEMVAGREVQELVYVVKLYLPPDYSQQVIKPAPIWFIQLLSGLEAVFNILTAVMEDLDKWEVHTEILCFRCLNEERHIVEAEIVKLTARATSYQECLNNYRFRLEAGSVPQMVHNLKGQADLPHTLQGQRAR